MALRPRPGNQGYQSTVNKAGLIQIASPAEAKAKLLKDKALVPNSLAQDGFMQWADVTITSAEVKALAASPKELVAAPGAGKMIVLMGASFKLNYGGTNAFTETDDNLLIKYTDGSGVALTGDIEMTGFITATADTYTNAVPVGDQIVAASAAENQALVLDNPDDEIAGNAANDNTVSVRVYYVVQSI